MNTDRLHIAITLAAIAFVAIAITQLHMAYRAYRICKHREQCGLRVFKRVIHGLHHGSDPVYCCTKCGMTAHIDELEREDYR